MLWEEFITYVESKDCGLYDNTDWAMPVYRKYGTGFMATFDLRNDLTSPAIVAICKYLDIERPPGYEQYPDIIEIIKGDD